MVASYFFTDKPPPENIINCYQEKVEPEFFNHQRRWFFHLLILPIHLSLYPCIAQAHHYI